ncbi:uncharacterized protein Triagg1_249 [Trichoderma aggressivum f. europaeum]|uniref:Uncharacterized protein n=1 Tax=Trichoderma aggressivum f. europaeum TaxID=173218 RepID=A0AAE1IN32_9HYPO|nr:hypothetical protein Triagg1_249 [Trichoderma aggressivum f. europaeum]
MLLSNREILEHDTYSFGASDFLMVTDLFEGIGIENYLAEYEIGSGAFYRANNLVRKKDHPKKQEIQVIEVFHSQKKQILWIWSLDVDEFSGTELTTLKKVNTPSMESQRLYCKWQDTWVEIANAQKGELGAAINKITGMGLKAKEITTEKNEERGIELRVVYLEDTTDYRAIGRVYTN